mmetsp:Transcript_5207/g.8052  ORF Transcript_5207/g.8052 Transcript_5207/m.8052 type:complete len:129 (+) Transcript_5207:1735-2121(+)
MFRSTRFDEQRRQKGYSNKRSLSRSVQSPFSHLIERKSPSSSIKDKKLPELNTQELLLEKRQKGLLHKMGYRSDRFREIIAFKQQLAEEAETKRLLSASDNPKEMKFYRSSVDGNLREVIPYLRKAYF